MKITCVVVGRLKEKYYTEAVKEYAKRLSRYCKLEIVELPDEKTPDGASAAEEAAILEREGEWAIPRELLGKLWHNRGLAQAGMFWMQEAADSLARAYGFLQDSDILKELFYLHLLEPGITISEEIAALIPAQQQYRWQEEYDVYDRQAANAPQVRRIDRAMKKDRHRKKDETERILTEWKQEYREMVK